MNTQRQRRPWQPHDIDLLRRFVGERYPDSLIAERLGRTTDAVTTKRHELGLLKQATGAKNRGR